ncbi:methyl-accepting chemotaxis sensory transducer with TarH sensor [Roseateles sp. YR242]|uniref:methyl-accepting chemotaxis protein n=1 Tax=Roseateles sp. YR242 TaxID=1855305 RepID=UPI0008CDF9BB|nr:methyl-accepting chemotaxis protein [Roseateles sp. YR242]SEK38370.1 methyl-accepting chemotaxis sensory transducer with TarH sensor [Roseateles sp. YR242]
MNWLDRLSVGAKLGLAFMSVVLLTAVMGGTGLFQLSRVSDAATAVGSNWMPSLSAAQVIRYQFIRHRMKEYRLLLSTDADRGQNEKGLLDVRADVLKSIQDEEKLSSTPEELDTVRQIRNSWQAYTVLSDKVVEVNRRNDHAGSMQAIKDGQAGYDVVLKGIERMIQLESDGSEAANQQSVDIAARSRWVIGGLTLAAMVLSLVMAVAITRAIVGRLAASVKLAEAVAQGDLRGTLAARGHDEVAQLQGALSRMVGQLRQVVGEVRHGVDAVSTASSQISSGNLDLSARTEQTASNLEQTASSMEELTGTVAQSADTARQANQLATHAAAAATRGGEVVGQVVQRMASISEASRRIADIIGAIDGIAFQTNILALNAAVEAARAGEHGKGFAVVASEVRALAQRSAEAAREIKGLIARSVETVEAGTDDVAQAGQSMEEIVTSVRRVTDLMGEIASASNEQRDGIHQVNQAVAQLDQMTQQNAALVEESSAASTSLQEQAQRLSEVVSVFRVA